MTHKNHEIFNLEFKHLANQIMMRKPINEIETTLLTLTIRETAYLLGEEEETLAKLIRKGLSEPLAYRRPRGKRIYFITIEVIEYIYTKILHCM